MGAFVRAKGKRDRYPNEIIELSKEVKKYLKSVIEEYPEEVLNGITQEAYAVDKARNDSARPISAAKQILGWLLTFVIW